MDLRGFLTHLLLVFVLAALVGVAVRAARRRGVDLIGRLVEVEDGRLAPFRAHLVMKWALAAFVPAAVLLSNDLTAADVGWAWPSDDGWTVVFAAAILVLRVVRNVVLRSMAARGRLVLPGVAV